MPALVALSATFALLEAVVGATLGEPSMVAASALSGGFGLLLVVAGAFARSGHARAVGQVLAAGVFLLGLASAAVIPGVSVAAAMLPVLSVVLVLDTADRRKALAVVVAALGGSVLILVLGHAPHPLPPLRPPLDQVFPGAMQLGVGLLILAALTDYATEARASLQVIYDGLRRQQAIFDGSLDAMFVADDGRIVTDANPAAEELLGVPRSEIVGRPVADFYRSDGDNLQVVWARFVASRATRSRLTIQRPDGQRRLVDAASRANIVPGQHLTVLHDVTEEVRMEEERARLAEAVAGERLAIVASLRHLERQDTAQATARAIAEALVRLPKIDVAGVFDLTDGVLTTLAMVAPAGFPLRDGDLMPAVRAAYLLKGVRSGPFAEFWVGSEELGDYGRAVSKVGILGAAYAPLTRGDELVGMIAIATTDEDHARHLVADLPTMAEFAATASALLTPQLVERRELASVAARIDAVVAARAFHPVFQPIVGLSTRQTVGYEALTRFDNGRPPNAMFRDAARAGRGRALELVTLGEAVRQARDLPRDGWLSLNVSPQLAADAAALGAVLAPRDRPIVLEITEHDAIDDYRAIRETVVLLGRDVRLAVDDAGAGVANFTHIVELRPDFVKVDAGLVRGVNADVARQAVVVALLHFASTAGCQVIAEGVETVAEYATLRSLGVTLGQGFLFGRPARAPRASSPGSPAMAAAALWGAAADTMGAVPTSSGAQALQRQRSVRRGTAPSASRRRVSRPDLLVSPGGLEPPTN